MRIRQTAMATIYAQAAREMSMVASQKCCVGLANDRIHGHDVAVRIRSYQIIPGNILNGGTDCIERVLTLQPSGMYKATTRQTFVPWLADMSVRDI